MTFSSSLKYILPVLLLLLIAVSRSVAQHEDESIYQFDSLTSSKKVRIVGLPVVFFSPETNLAFGGGAQFFFLRKSNVYNARKSNMFVSAIYTLNNQFLIDIKPQIYLSKGDYFLDMAYKFKIFPNSFWGLGGNTPDENLETYDMTSNELIVGFIKRLPPNLNFGFEFIFLDHNVTQVEEGGLLASGDILGSDKARITGLGVVFNLDTRDDIASPFSGNLLQMKAQFSSQNLGATSSYNKYIFDLRTYRKLGLKSIIALQLYTENAFGEVPFQGKSWYGGGERARGYFRGRFIDDLLYVVQAEYRVRIKERWTAAGFLLVGEVSDRLVNYFNFFKPAAGGGIRYKLTKDQNTLLRVDIGIGVDGNNGFYFGINEAF